MTNHQYTIFINYICIIFKLKKYYVIWIDHGLVVPKKCIQTNVFTGSVIFLKYFFFFPFFLYLFVYLFIYLFIYF